MATCALEASFHVSISFLSFFFFGFPSFFGVLVCLISIS